jgi:hypothetical protein
MVNWWEHARVSWLCPVVSLQQVDMEDIVDLAPVESCNLYTTSPSRNGLKYLGLSLPSASTSSDAND